jgi:hypothetical protein
VELVPNPAQWFSQNAPVLASHEQWGSTVSVSTWVWVGQVTPACWSCSHFAYVARVCA